MATLVTLTVDDPQNVIDTYGSGALIRLERDTVEAMTSASEVTTVAVDAAKTEYEYRDQTGVDGTHWYRTRFSTASPSVAADYSGYSDPWLAGAYGGELVTLETAKAYLGVTGTASDGILGTFVGWVNEFTESYIGARIGPGGTATRTFDSDGSPSLYIPRGIRSAGTVSIRDQTNGTYTALASTDWVIRPASHERKPGWPGQWIVIVDGDHRRRTPVGYDIWRVTDGAWGWGVVPADLRMFGTTMVARVFQRRQTGQSDAVGSDEFGNAIISAMLSPEDRYTLDRYRNAVHAGWVG